MVGDGRKMHVSRRKTPSPPRQPIGEINSGIFTHSPSPACSRGGGPSLRKTPSAKYTCRNRSDLQERGLVVETVTVKPMLPKFRGSTVARSWPGRCEPAPAKNAQLMAAGVTSRILLATYIDLDVQVDRTRCTPSGRDARTGRARRQRLRNPLRRPRRQLDDRRPRGRARSQPDRRQHDRRGGIGRSVLPIFCCCRLLGSVTYC